MRKFWIVLLALGLVAAFSMPVWAAVDGKFSGSLRMRGWYDNNIKSLDKDKYTGAGASQFYDNRLRLQPTFKIAEGLALTVRFDALEKKWGQTLSSVAGGVDFNDSVNLERAYVNFKTKAGEGQIGYQTIKEWGTVFGNSASSAPRIKWTVPVGDLSLFGIIEKVTEDTTNVGKNIDSDRDRYQIGGVYKFKGGDVGMMIEMEKNAINRTAAATPYTRQYYTFNPYVKYKAGAFYLESEAYYTTGDYAKYEQGTTVPMPSDIKFEQKAFYLKANMDFAPMYAGALLAYGSGDDPDTADKMEGGLFADQGLNSAWNAALMLQSYEYRNQVGRRQGNATAAYRTSEYTDNTWFWQVYAGVKPMKELDIQLALSYSYADKKPKIAGVEFVSDKYGTELDLTATYKIYDNLSYMVGFGYLWVGDYYKGTDNTVVTGNDYLVMHQLMLSF